MVYGDIGTSPLYTLRACLTGLSVHTDLEPAHLLGVLSILFWMLMVVVSLKYVTLILRADNRGEGGTLALLELAVRNRDGKLRWILIVLGIFGAALFLSLIHILHEVFIPMYSKRNCKTTLQSV